MSHWLWALVLALFAGEALAQDNRFLLINGTSYPIRELALSPRDLNDWGPNVLHAPAIKAGESRYLVFPASTTDCIADIRVVFADDGSQAVWQYLNMCLLTKIRLRYDRMSGVTTASYDD
jgi:hypothetical protein